MVDQKASQYPAYIEDCRKLFEEYEKKMKDRRSAFEGCGLDGDDIADLCRERNKKLRQLQVKYGF